MRFMPGPAVGWYLIPFMSLRGPVSSDEKDLEGQRQSRQLAKHSARRDLPGRGSVSSCPGPLAIFSFKINYCQTMSLLPSVLTFSPRFSKRVEIVEQISRSCWSEKLFACSNRVVAGDVGKYRRGAEVCAAASVCAVGAREAGGKSVPIGITLRI